MSVEYLHGLQALLAKASGTPDATNAINAFDAVFNYDITELPRENAAKRSLGPQEHAIGLRRCSITFRTPIRVSGVPSSSTSEKEKVLWEACGLTESTGETDYDTDTKYSLANDPTATTCVIWFYVDGLVRKMTECQGTVRIVAEAGQLGWYEWTFFGTLSDKGSAAAIPADIEDEFPTQVHQPVHGATFDIGSVTDACVRRMSIDLGGVINYHPKWTDTTNGGTGSPYQVQRNPTIELQLEEPAIGTKDWYSDVLINNPAVLTGAGDVEMYVGTGADLVTIFRAQAQWNGIRPIDNNGVRDLVLTGGLREASGEIDDQLAIYMT